MFKTHHQKEIVNLYSVDPNETISTAKYENSSWGEEVQLTLVVKPFICLDQKKNPGVRVLFKIRGC